MNWESVTSQLMLSSEPSMITSVSFDPYSELIWASNQEVRSSLPFSALFPSFPLPSFLISLLRSNF